MSSSSDLHSDILYFRGTTFPAEDVRFVLLRDRVVECVVALDCIQAGSFDPLVQRVFAEIRKSPVIHMSELFRDLGAENEYQQRLVAEIVHALLLANRITVDERNLVTSIVHGGDVTELFATRIEERFTYVPRARLLLRGSKGDSWKVVNDSALSQHGGVVELKENQRFLYSRMGLDAAIQEAVREEYNDRSVVGLQGLRRSGNQWQPIIGEEQLRVRGLLHSKSYLLACEVREIAEPQRWLVSRCYLFGTDNRDVGDWNLRVYRYKQGPAYERYTRRLLDCKERAPRVIQSLCQKSVRITH